MKHTQHSSQPRSAWKRLASTFGFAMHRDGGASCNRFGRSRLSIRSIAALLIGLAAGWNSFASSHATAQDITGDPLGDIAFDMNIAVRRLAKTLTDETTQQVQTDIVGRLDTLIEQLEKQRQSMGPGRSGPRPTDPAKSSVVMKGPGGSGPLHQARKDGKHWAELPPHERDRIMQSMTEGFPAHYQNILESYFKRLAEEKPPEAQPSADGGNLRAPAAKSSTTVKEQP